MPRVKSVTNPSWVKARKVLMLQAETGSTETIYRPRPVGFTPASQITFNQGHLSHSHGRSIDPMTGKLL